LTTLLTLLLQVSDDNSNESAVPNYKKMRAEIAAVKKEISTLRGALRVTARSYRKLRRLGVDDMKNRNTVPSRRELMRDPTSTLDGLKEERKLTKRALRALALKYAQLLLKLGYIAYADEDETQRARRLRRALRRIRQRRVDVEQDSDEEEAASDE